MIEQSQLAAQQMPWDALLAGKILDGTTFDPELYVRPASGSAPAVEVPAEAEPEAIVASVEGEMLGAGVDSFHGRLEMAELTSPWPEMNFTVLTAEENRLVIESERAYPWPQIKIDLELDDARQPKAVRGVHLDPADRTVDAELFYTRVVFALVGNGFLRLRDLDNDRELKLRVRAEEDDWFYLRSKQARKLKFIEDELEVRFRLPEEARRSDATRIEMIFRCLTEGQYRQRRDVLTLAGYVPETDELGRPPFGGAGPFVLTYAEELAVYDYSLDVTPASIHLDWAEVFDLDELEESLRAGQPPAEVSFLVLDHQVLYRFPKYESQAEHSRVRLAKFRERLIAEEPVELADLLTASVEKPVSEEEARRIVVGWLRSHKFPDGFWPQDPMLEGGRWRVPVWIAYPVGPGAPVEDVFVDCATGKVEAPVSAQEMLERGGSVAEALLRAG
jgi:hypothetical protein